MLSNGNLGLPLYWREIFDKLILISPYVFIIYAKYLDIYIHFMLTQINSRLGIKLTKDSPNIFYLMFAYYCLSFLQGYEVNNKRAYSYLGTLQ